MDNSSNFDFNVTAAMLNGRNNKMFLHENEFNSPGEIIYLLFCHPMDASIFHGAMDFLSKIINN
jgi:hypothetical protein